MGYSDDIDHIKCSVDLCKHAKQIVGRKHRHANTVDVMEILQATCEGLLSDIHEKINTSTQT
jgi:hypothetical protein